MFTIPVFKYKWIDNKSGVKIDESRMTLVDFRKVGYRDEPFIMAQQATQDFYVTDRTTEHLMRLSSRVRKPRRSHVELIKLPWRRMKVRKLEDERRSGAAMVFGKALK